MDVGKKELEKEEEKDRKEDLWGIGKWSRIIGGALQILDGIYKKSKGEGERKSKDDYK